MGLYGYHWQVIYPNNLFSAMIISSVIPDGNIKKTADWQLLLQAISLPGVLVGAWLCNRIGRRNTVGIKVLNSVSLLRALAR